MENLGRHLAQQLIPQAVHDRCFLPARFRGRGSRTVHPFLEHPDKRWRSVKELEMTLDLHPSETWRVSGWHDPLVLFKKSYASGSIRRPVCRSSRRSAAAAYTTSMAALRF